METTKISKKDKNQIVIILICGFIANFITESGMNISIGCFFIYTIHKYVGTTKNISEYKNYEFRDKDKYDKGRKLFVGIVDVYIVIRIISMIIYPKQSYIFPEMIVIVLIYNLYEKHLDKKYVINTNLPKEKTRRGFAKQIKLTSIVIIGFTLFSIFTYNEFRKLEIDNKAKYGTHQYNLATDKDNKKIEIEIGSHYMMAEENEKNSKYFNKFSTDAKTLMKKQMFKSYTFICIIFMVIICLCEAYPKDKNIISISGNIAVVVLLLLGMFNFNYDLWNEELELSTYFHEYMNR